MSSGVKALRVGFGGNVRSSLLEHTLDHKLSIHPLQPTLLKLIKREEELSTRLVDLETRLKNVRDTESSGNARIGVRGDRMQKALLAMQGEHGALKSRKYAMQQEMLRDVISDADVVSIRIGP